MEKVAGPAKHLPAFNVLPSRNDTGNPAVDILAVSHSLFSGNRILSYKLRQRTIFLGSDKFIFSDNEGGYYIDTQLFGTLPVTFNRIRKSSLVQDQFGRVFNCDHTVVVLNKAGQRVQHGGLTRTGTTRDNDIQASLDGTLEQRDRRFVIGGNARHRTARFEPADNAKGTVEMGVSARVDLINPQQQNLLEAPSNQTWDERVDADIVQAEADLRAKESGSMVKELRRTYRLKQRDKIFEVLGIHWMMILIQ